MQIVYYANILAGTLESSRKEENDDSLPEDDSLHIYPGTRKTVAIDFTDSLAEELHVNVRDCRKPYIPFEEFYNEPLSDAIEMDQDYLFFKNLQGRMLLNKTHILYMSDINSLFFKKNISGNRFSFMLNSFILTPATKTLGLYYDCRIRMYNERLLSNPYLKLMVRRDHIIEDALVELDNIAMVSPKDFKKQLVCS